MLGDTVGAFEIYIFMNQCTNIPMKTVYFFSIRFSKRKRFISWFQVNRNRTGLGNTSICLDHELMPQGVTKEMSSILAEQ
jgi:hypothetical protein